MDTDSDSSGYDLSTAAPSPSLCLAASRRRVGGSLALNLACRLKLHVDDRSGTSGGSALNPSLSEQQAKVCLKQIKTKLFPGAIERSVYLERSSTKETATISLLAFAIATLSCNCSCHPFYIQITFRQLSLSFIGIIQARYSCVTVQTSPFISSNIREHLLRRSLETGVIPNMFRAAFDSAVAVPKQTEMHSRFFERSQTSASSAVQM